MKICPQCQTTYTDDGLQFCLQDGTPLNFVSSNSQQPTEIWNSEPETVIKPDRNQIRFDLPQTNQPQVTQPQNYQTNQNTNFQTEPPKKSKLWIFLLLGLLGVLAIGAVAVVGAFMFLNPSTNIVQNNSNAGQNNSSNSNNLNNSNANANLTPTPTATPTPKPTLKPAEIESAKKEAESTVYGWKTAAENHNLDTNLSSYADTVDYYKGGKINKSKLRASKEPAYKKYDTINIEISNMKVIVDPTGEKATVTFDKEWDFSGVDKDGNDIYTSGKVTQQLGLIKVNGKWKISSEKDMKVHYVDKSSSGDDAN